MVELDLSDQLIRQMADDNHTPRESWSAAGILQSVHCRTCGHPYPCPTRMAVDRASGRMCGQPGGCCYP